MAYTIEDGKDFVTAARSVLEISSMSPRFDVNLLANAFRKFDTKEMVAVRIIHHPTGTTIGFGITEERAEVINGVINKASEAISKNKGLTKEALSEMVTEVSILEEPVKMSQSPIMRLRQVELGKDGIVIEYGTKRFTFLPSYPVEKNLEKQAFFESACKESGLPEFYWKQPNINMYKFSAQTFVEETPGGNIVKR